MSSLDSGYEDEGQKKARLRKETRDALRTFTNEVITGQKNKPRETQAPPAPVVTQSDVTIHGRALTLGEQQPPSAISLASQLPGVDTLIATQWNILRNFNSSNQLLLGVYHHSNIYNTGKPGDTITPTHLLTSINPTPTDGGWFTITSFPSIVYLECTCGPVSGWATNVFFTASAIKMVAGSDVLPDGGFYEMTFSAPATGHPAFARVPMAIAHSAADIEAQSLIQLITKTGTVLAWDAGLSNSLNIMFAAPGSP